VLSGHRELEDHGIVSQAVNWRRLLGDSRQQLDEYDFRPFLTCTSTQRQLITVGFAIAVAL